MTWEYSQCWPAMDAREKWANCTRCWTLTEADVLAVRDGYWFDWNRANYAITWIEENCILYEGDWAGEPMTLDDWQYTTTAQLFGWVGWSRRWGRPVRRFTHASIWVPKKNKKALSLTTLVPTPSGWTTVADLHVGDVVFDVEGNPTRVVDETPVFHNRPCYEVKFSNGQRIVCDEGHLWVTRSLREEVSIGGRGNRRRIFGIQARETKEIAETLFRESDGARSHTLDMPLPIGCPQTGVVLPPYVLGAWLGDGDSDAARLTVHQDDAEHFRREFATAGWPLREFKRRPDSLAGRMAIGKRWGRFRTLLRQMNLFKHKHIPPEYLRGSISQRLALLQGLMDTDGCASKAGQSIFSTSNHRLMLGVSELLSTLGIKFSCIRIECTRSWRFTFHTFRDVLPVFRMDRKLERLRVSDRNVMGARSRTLQIIDARPVPSVPVKCITIESSTSQFLVGETMIPTHNSPTLAAWGLYLLYADCEPGQKIFLCAKDGRQAREIAGKHAAEMVRQSPLLDHFGRINKTETSITVEKTKSVLRPLASANVRSQKAQEGLNGCILVDETHVVDADYMARLARAGISRSEPLQIEVSTVGDDPDSYGMEQFNTGREVEAGRLKNHHLLFVCYSAPQTVADNELAANILKYGMMANPAMAGKGYATSAQTIDPDEFLNDFETSRVSPSRLARFKMYRLNIWQRSSEPWLSMTHWDRNTRDFSAVDLKDRWCTWGLDLSRGMDLTALTAIFPDMEFEEFAGRLDEAAVDNKAEGEGGEGNGDGGEGWTTVKIVPEDIPCQMLTWYWIPEGTVERQEHLIEWRTWERHGWITIQKNTDITRYDLIEADMAELLKMFDVRMLSFDGKYATELVTRLVLFHGFDEDRLYVFPQTMKNFCGPTAKFERLVLGGMLHPNPNQLLKWQAGNVRTWEDANENKRPIKEKRHDIRTIDGIVGGVMGLDGLTSVESTDYGVQVL